MNVNMLHINFQPKQLWIADEKLKCLIHGLELRRGFFLSFFPSDTPHYENVPFEIPNSWVWTTLGSVCNFENGFAFSSDDYKQTGVPLIRISNISDNTIDLNGCVFIQKEIDDRFVVEKGDLLIALSGATTGKMGVYSTDKVAYLNQRVGNLRIIDTSVLCHEYRNIFINSRTEAILKLAYGGAQPNISGSVICSFSFPLPPLAEQLRIATEVNHWFALIDQIEQGKADLQETIKQTKSKILDLAIHGKLVPQDPNDEPAIELLKRINLDYTPCDNGHYPQLPDSWCVAPMQTLCSLNDGEKQKNIERINLDVKYLRGERDAKMLSAGKFIAANSLLILVDGENSGEVFRTPIEGYQGSTFKQLTINSHVNTDYVLQVINLHRKILRENKIGSAIPHLNKKLFKAIEVPIPPYSEQKRIVKAVNLTFKQLDAITESL